MLIIRSLENQMEMIKYHRKNNKTSTMSVINAIIITGSLTTAISLTITIIVVIVVVVALIRMRMMGVTSALCQMEKTMNSTRILGEYPT